MLWDQTLATSYPGQTDRKTSFKHEESVETFNHEAKVNVFVVTNDLF